LSAFVSRDVVFDEESMFKKSQRWRTRRKVELKTVQQILIVRSLSFQITPQAVKSDEDSSELDGDMQEDTQEKYEQPRSLRRSVRVLAPPIKYD